jgi:HAD superfamily hydrolase (TIGR01509 family)
MTGSAIIFDCDGVLVNSEQIAIAVERALLEDLGLTYTDADYQSRFVGLSDARFETALRADFVGLGRGTFPDDFMTQVRAECWHRFTSELQAVEGLTDYLATLDCPVAVASSSGVRSLERKLTLTGLAERFAPHAYSGDLVENGKPAPDLFLYAATQLGYEPHRCIVIEDSANGVRAGVSAGMMVWGFTGGGHADEGLAGRLHHAGAHHVFASYPEMQTGLSVSL